MKAGIASMLVVLVTVHFLQGYIIDTAQGKLRGLKSSDGSYVSFKGIPYVGTVGKAHRFKKAPQAKGWTDIRDATQEPSPCLSQSLAGNEDCLFLNLHVPTTASQSLPVLVWIHGGGFSSGSGSPRLYGPEYLAKNSIILVTVNYRLGPLGFLCLKHEAVPGNAGAKDVVMALRWVRDNIVAFRGNPNRVTIAGQSSGGALVEALLFSPMAEGLFHGAIIQSGSIFSPWTFRTDAENRAKSVALRFTDSNDLDAIANALKEIEIYELLKEFNEIDYNYFAFTLCTENPFKKEECFLCESPYNKIRLNRKVPLIIGYNSDESYILAPFLLESSISFKRDPSSLIPFDFKINSESLRNTITKRLQGFYFPKKNTTIRNLLDFHNDLLFLSHIYRSIKAHADSGEPLYVYEFDHVGKYGIQEVDGAKKIGAAHSDELAYLFKADDIDDINGEDSNVKDHITLLWSNFIRKGNPTPTGSSLPNWSASTADQIKVYTIKPNPELKDFRHGQRCRMWEELYNQYSSHNKLI